MWACRWPHTFLALFSYLLVFFILFLLLLPSSVRSIAVDPTAAPHSLPTHVTAIKSKQTGVPCQNKFRGVANHTIPPSFSKNPQKTHCSLTESISSDKCKYVSAFYVFIFRVTVCMWVSVSGGHEGGKYGRQTMFPNPHVRPVSLNLSLLSTTVGPFRHTADVSAVLLLHCQGANKPWKMSIWRSSDQSLACTWKLSYMCVPGARMAPEHCAIWQAYDSVRRNWWWAKRLDTLGFSAAHSLCRCEQCFGSSQNGADPNLWIWYQLVTA